MRRVVVGVVVGVLVLALGLAAAVIFEMHHAPSQGRGQVVRLTVPEGQPFAVLSRRLEAAGLVRRARPLRLYAAVTRVDRRIQTGTYEFEIGESPVDIVRRLVEGDILQMTVTIPEGFTMWEIAGAYADAGIDSVAMLAAIRDPALRQRRRIPAPSLEGYLFPDTYRVPHGSGPSEAVAQMLRRMDAVFDAVLVARAAEMGMTPHQVLTLASIIEAEARVASERPLISAVYHKRLARGMRLEADPTVAYAMDGFRGRLLRDDLKIDSPYNTYRNAGLPPGPICSPGEASIRAALYPAADEGWLYFVARGDGSHVFSRTLREHNQAVREVRRAREAPGGG